MSLKHWIFLRKCSAFPFVQDYFFFSFWSVLKFSFPSGSDSKEPACNTGDLGSICRSRRFPGEGNGNPLQYSCLENSVDKGAWWAIVHRVTKGWTRLSDYHFHIKFAISYYHSWIFSLFLSFFLIKWTYIPTSYCLYTWSLLISV